MTAGKRLAVHHFIAPARCGGAESVVAELCRGMAERGHEVRVSPVLSGPPEDHPFVGELEEAGASILPLVVDDRAYRTEWVRARRLLERKPPQVVHTHGFRPDLLEGTVARRLGLPTVTTVHGFTGRSWRIRLYGMLQRRAYRSFDGVVAVSAALARDLAESGVPHAAIHEVPNARPGTASLLEAAEAREELDVPEDAFHLGWVGRLSPEKGPDVFLRALSELSEPEMSSTRPPAVASVLGAGPLASELSSLARELGLDGRVRWHGEVPDARRLFRAFDVVVLSSRTEGTPIVLLEALDAGVPVVATRVGGIPDLVSSLEALLVPGERPDLLAGAIREVRKHPEQAAERAERALERLRRERSTERWIDRYERVYRDALSNHDGNGDHR